MTLSELVLFGCVLGDNNLRANLGRKLSAPSNFLGGQPKWIHDQNARKLRPRLIAEWPIVDNEAEVKVINNLCYTDYMSGFYKTLNQWSKSRVINMKTYRMSNGSCGNYNFFQGFINVCNGSFPNKTWIGIAQMMKKRIEKQWIMISARVTLNDEYLTNKIDHPATSYADFRQYVTCHEIGHTLGLPHLHGTKHFNKNKGSCMDYTYGPEGGKKKVHGKMRNFGNLKNLQPHKRDFKVLFLGYTSDRNRQLEEDAFIEDDNKPMTIQTVDAEDLLASLEFDATNDFGVLISEVEENGVVEKTYENEDAETGIMIVTESFSSI